MVKILSFFAGLALIISWTIPNHYVPWATAYNEFSIFLAALLVAIVILKNPIKITKSVIFFSILATIPLIQFYAGIIFFWGDAFITALYLVGFASMLLIGYNIGKSSIYSKNAYIILAYLFISGSIVSIGLELYQWLQIGNSLWIADLPPDGRPFANFGQPNMLATLLCIGIASILYLFEIRKIHIFTATLCSIFILFGITLTQSRTPWIGAIAVIVWWSWKTHSLHPRISTKWLVLWIVTYAAFIFILPVLSQFVGTNSIDLVTRSTSFERLGIWKQLWVALVNGPFWGYGWNQISVAQYEVSNIIPSSTLTEHSHNILLDLLLWNGPMLGSLIIIVIGVWLLKLSIRVRSLESVFGLMAISFLIIHAMLEFPLDYAYFLLPAGLLIGMVETDQLPTRVFTLPRPIFLIFLGAAGFLYITVWKEYRLIDEDCRLLRFENARVGTLKAKQLTPDITLLTQLREFNRFMRTEPNKHMSAEQLLWMEHVAHRYPFIVVLYRYNLALMLNHQPNAKLEINRIRGSYNPKTYKQIMEQIEIYNQRHVESPQQPDMTPLNDITKNSSFLSNISTASQPRNSLQ